MKPSLLPRGRWWNYSREPRAADVLSPSATFFQTFSSSREKCRPELLCSESPRPQGLFVTPTLANHPRPYWAIPRISLSRGVS